MSEGDEAITRRGQVTNPSEPRRPARSRDTHCDGANKLTTMKLKLNCPRPGPVKRKPRLSVATTDAVHGAEGPLNRPTEFILILNREDRQPEFGSLLRELIERDAHPDDDREEDEDGDGDGEDEVEDTAGESLAVVLEDAARSTSDPGRQ